MPITGVVDARTEDTVASNLSGLGYNVIYIQKQGEAAALSQKFLSKLQKIKYSEIVLFSRQLSVMLKAGLSLTNAINSIIEQTENKKFQDVVEKVLRNVEAGDSLSTAFAKYPAVFPEVLVNMVKTGEAGGILDEVLERFSVLGYREIEIQSRIKAAITYPVVLVIVSVSIVTFLMVSVIPKFVTIFETYSAKLPLATRVLLGISYLIKNFWFVLLAVIIFSSIALSKYIKTEKGRYQFDLFWIKVPIFGQLYLKIITSRMTLTLGELIKSGIPILEALSVTEKTVSNKVVSKVLQNIRVAITEGQSLTEPFKNSGVFPPMVVQMIALGEKTGDLDRMLLEVANYYDQETDRMIKSLVTALEPLLLLIMGGMVAFIALSVLLPIFNLVKVFRG